MSFFIYAMWFCRFLIKKNVLRPIEMFSYKNANSISLIYINEWKTFSNKVNWLSNIKLAYLKWDSVSQLYCTVVLIKLPWNLHLELWLCTVKAFNFRYWELLRLRFRVNLYTVLKTWKLFWNFEYANGRRVVSISVLFHNHDGIRCVHQTFSLTIYHSWNAHVCTLKPLTY